MSRWLEYCQNWLEIHFFLYFWINMMRFANFGFVCKGLWIKNYQLILMFSSVSLFGLFSASLFTLQYMHAWAKICCFFAPNYSKTMFNVSFPHEAIWGSDFFSAQVDAFPNITSGQRPRVIWRNASTSAEKKSNPRIASWGKGIL